MKRIIFSLFFVLVTISIMQARTFVLITGVSNYGNEDVNLSQTTKDAKNFNALMQTQTKDITLLTSKNVTHDNVLEKLRAICNRAQADDRVIFYYSGHGMPGALYAYDRPISYDELTALLSKSAAKQKIAFIDACHAGSAADAAPRNEWTKSVKERNDMAFFVSCRADEVSWENSFLGAGYFTQALLKGMRGKADKNNDRNVTVIELFKYIYGDVTRRSGQEQHPQLIAPKNMYDQQVIKW